MRAEIPKEILSLDPVIAGGHALRLFLEQVGLKSGRKGTEWLHSDVDFWFLDDNDNPQVYDLLADFNNQFELRRNYYVKDMDGVHLKYPSLSKLGMGFDRIGASSSANTFFGHRQYQFVKMLRPASIIELLDGFDISACKVAIYKECFFFSKDFDIKTIGISDVSSRSNVATTARLIKYFNRLHGLEENKMIKTSYKPPSLTKESLQFILNTYIDIHDDKELMQLAEDIAVNKYRNPYQISPEDLENYYKNAKRFDAAKLSIITGGIANVIENHKDLIDKTMILRLLFSKDGEILKAIQNVIDYNSSFVLPQSPLIGISDEPF